MADNTNASRALSQVILHGQIDLIIQFSVHKSLFLTTIFKSKFRFTLIILDHGSLFLARWPIMELLY